MGKLDGKTALITGASRGLGTAMAIAFIGAFASGLMTVVHAAALAGMLPTKPVKLFAIFMWTVFSVCFLVVIILGFAVYSAEWTCDNPVCPTVRLSDSFNLSYGIPFAIIGFVSSLLSVVISAVGLSSKVSSPPASSSY